MIQVVNIQICLNFPFSNMEIFFILIGDHKTSLLDNAYDSDIQKICKFTNFNDKRTRQHVGCGLTASLNIIYIIRRRMG